MKKSAVVIIIFILLIGGIFFLRPQIREKAVIKTVPEQSVPDAAQEDVSFSAFIQSEGSYRCTAENTVAGTSGDLYVNNGNLKGSYNTIHEGKPLTVSFVARDGYTYTWTNASANGIKGPMRIDEDTKEEGGGKDVLSWNVDQVGEYQCEPWQRADENFIIPDSVNFSEIKGKPVLN